MAIAPPLFGITTRESTTMAKPLLSDELWDVIEPLLPTWTPSPKGGQPPVPDRDALTGILFVLKTGIPWEDLPCEMTCGCGMTCWRRLRDWQADGTWDKIPKTLLDRLRGADKIDWSRALIDSSFVRAAYGGGATGPSPVDRGKPGSKHHLITDAGGIPLASAVTAANVNDISQLAPLFNALAAVAGKVGPPRTKPDAVQGDLAYDSESHRQGFAGAGDRADPSREGDRRPERPGRDPLADRADAVLGPPEPPAPHPLRDPAGHPSGVPHPSLHQDLCKCIVLRVLLGGLMASEARNRSRADVRTEIVSRHVGRTGSDSPQGSSYGARDRTSVTIVSPLRGGKLN